MYLMINGNRHSVSRRMVTKDTIKFLTVEPKPETISGNIQMYENNGFLISEDNADSFLRSTYSGTLLVLTNVPEPTPVERPTNVPSEIEQIRADVDYIAIMTGVEL